MKTELKKKAKLLRVRGHSIKEIASELEVSQSTVSIWVRAEVLSKSAQSRIDHRSMLGRKHASAVLIQKRILRQNTSVTLAKKLFTDRISHADYILCSMIYECEGGKGEFGTLEFTNSDPQLVKIFLSLLRKVFTLDESKLRVVMHLHSYHTEVVEKMFWSKVTTIPINQFTKTYQKKESGNVRKVSYRGCVQIKYFDVNIKRILLACKPLLMSNMGL